MPILPKAIGRPGRMAIFQNSTSPRRAISCLTKSASPTETPPVVMTASALAGGLAERGLQQRRIVAHHAHVDDLDAEALQHAVQRVAVGVVDLAFLERRADRGQLVAGGEEGDAQPAPDLHLADAERGDQAELGGAQQLPRLQHRHARLEVLARGAHVLARLLPGRDRDAVAVGAAHLLHDDGVRALRHHRAGHHAHAFAGPDFAVKRLFRQAPCRFPAVTIS